MLRSLCLTVTCVVLGSSTSLLAADPLLDVRKEGWDHFPQKVAKVLCDNKDLRLSAWNDKAHLYVQAVLWGDDNISTLRGAGSNIIGDNSMLVIDVEADGKLTTDVDRSYTLHPWGNLPGLRYQLFQEKNASPTIKHDSKGRGSIRLVDSASGKIRVDSFVLPLAEIGRKAGDKVRFAYWGQSIKPNIILDSLESTGSGAGFTTVLLEKYHDYTLVDRPVSLDAGKVADGQDDVVPVADILAVVTEARGVVGLQMTFDKDKMEVVVTDVVADRPAALAGMKTGDVILKLNDTAVKDQNQAGDLIRAMKPGAEAVFRVRRQGKELDVTVKVGNSQDFVAGYVPVRWKYDTGRFEQQTGRLWIESGNDGTKVEFRETDRIGGYIELYDKNRDIGVRLFNNKMEIKQPEQTEYKTFRTGSWKY